MTSEKAASTSSFVDSLGVNFNISPWTSEANENVTAAENALAYLGFKMIRSTPFSINLPAYQQFNHDLGIKYDFMASGVSTAAFNASLQLIKANPGIIDFVEGTNESDEPDEAANYNGLTGLPALSAEMKVLYDTVHSDSKLTNVGVIQASFGIPASFAAYGDHASTANYTNSHIYYNFFPFGTDPMHRDAAWMKTLLADAQTVTPGAPNIVTESGYETMVGSGADVSLIDQAKYLLDDVFDLWNQGVVKSFVYMLVDYGPNVYDPTNFRNSYGLYNADWTPKPAAIALHNLLTLLNTTGSGTVAPGSLSYSLSGKPSTVYTTLLEKSDGTFVLAIWNDVQLQNSAGVDTPVADVPVTLTLAETFKSITIYDPLTGTGAVQSVGDARSIQIMVPDHPILIEISNSEAVAPVAAANVPVIEAPAKLLVAADSIAQVGGVSVGNDKLGLIDVRVTASHGTLSAQDANGQAVAGSGMDSITLAGSAATVNAELATLAYTASSASGDSISLQVEARGITKTDFITVASIARPAYSATFGPLLSVPTDMVVGTGTKIAIPDAVLTDDYYATHSGNLTLTVSVDRGTLQMRVNGAELAAARSHTLTGSYATIAADLASLTYTAAGALGADELAFEVKDPSGHTTTASTAITVTWDLAIAGPGAMKLDEGATGNVGVQINDAQKAGNADELQVTVTDVTGTLTMLNSSGGKMGGSGSHIITLSGTPDWVNGDLATLTETAPRSGASDTITVKVKDGEGSAPSASFHVTVVAAASAVRDSLAVNASVAAPEAVAAPAIVSAPVVLPVTGGADGTAAAGGQVTAKLTTYFQLDDSAGGSLGRMAFLKSGDTVLTAAATGLNGAVSEQVENGTVTLDSEQWNKVDAVNVADKAGGSYVLDDFRSVDATLQAGPAKAGRAQSLTIDTAQNGTITLGTGNQNIYINAGVGGTTSSTNKTFIITEGSGSDFLKVTGYAGYLPARNVADLTTAIVKAGAGSDSMDFIDAHANVTAGSGTLTIYGSNYGTSVTAGTGKVTVWGGSGWNDFTYHSGDGMMTVEDFDRNDTLILDKSLQAGMTEKNVSGGVELVFAGSPRSAIVLHGQIANLASQISWHS